MTAPAPSERIDREVLDDVAEYLAEREDVRDGEDGRQLPNEAMSLLMRLKEEREKPTPTTPQYSALADEVPTRLLAAYTPERYEGAYPPYFNITQVGSMVRITVRGATKADGSGECSRTAIANSGFCMIWSLNAGSI